MGGGAVLECWGGGGGEEEGQEEFDEEGSGRSGIGWNEMMVSLDSVLKTEEESQFAKVRDCKAQKTRLVHLLPSSFSRPASSTSAQLSMSRAQRGPVPPPVASTSRAILPPKKPRRALTLASTSSLAQSYDGEATGGGTTTTALGQTSRKKRKKLTHVREEVDQPPSSSSSSSSSSPEPADVGEGHDEKEMTDPRNLPANGHGRKRRALKGLEFGMYHSALRDSVEGECDLGRVLCDWEGMRREREMVEKREEEDKVPVDPTLDPSLVAESEADARRGRRDDGPHRLPGSLLLTQIARWPLVPSLCPPGPAIDDTIETLQDVANYNRRKLAAPGKKVRKRLRSAYEPNAPLALPPKTPRSAGSNDSFSPSSSSSSDDSPCESEEEDDLHSDPDPLTPLLLPLLDELLLRLSTYIPRSPFPAENPTAFKARPDKTRRGEGVGWEKVWYGARDMGMSEVVTDKLRMRMEEVYGPAQLTRKSRSL